jgi:hypothetical protein
VGLFISTIIPYSGARFFNMTNTLAVLAINEEVLIPYSGG